MANADIREKGADGLTVAERLSELKRERGLETYAAFAARCGVPENTAKGWLGGVSLPGGRHLRGIRKGFGLSADFVLDGVSSPSQQTSETIGSVFGSMAPESVPESLREGYGGLVQSIGYALTGSREYHGQPEKKPTLRQAQAATLRVVTAMMAEIRRSRGDRRQSPEALLEQLRNYRGAQGVMRYLLWSELAAQLAIPRYDPREASDGRAGRRRTQPQRRKQ